MQKGLYGFLKQVGFLIRLLNLHDLLQDYIYGSSIITLKSPIKIVFS